MLDPAAAPHHRESLLDFHTRVRAWLADVAAAPEAVTVAVTHGGVVRSAVTHALNVPPAVMWRIGVAPLSITELGFRDDGFVTLLEPSRSVLAPFASATAV